MIDRRHLILDAATVDAAYAGRFIGSLARADSRVGPVATFCMFSYFSLFAHESYERLKELDPPLAQQISLSAAAAKVVARSRHSLKLFEDTKRRVNGQLIYFRDEIIPAHRAMFIDRIRFPFLKFLGNDLGIYSYDGVPVSSTHAATFALGIEPQALFGTDAGRKQREVAREYGQYFAEWGAKLDQQSLSFPAHMSATHLEDRDVRSDSVYRCRFNGSGTPDINALLSVFQASLNVADKLLSLDTEPVSLQTTVKLKYLAAYQIIRSLEILFVDQAAQLRSESRDTIRSIVGHPTARLITDPSKRPFRNTLMHYGPDSRIDLTQLSFGRPLYGLVEECFSMDLASFDTLLATLIAHLASEMNNWAGA
ncbi:MAG: hypothetical protein WCF17_05770 [Terracidiphilus sp.]